MNKIQVTGTLNKFKNRTTFSRAPCDGVATNMDTLGVLELAQEEAEEHRNRVVRRRALRIFKDRYNPIWRSITASNLSGVTDSQRKHFVGC